VPPRAAATRRAPRRLPHHPALLRLRLRLRLRLPLAVLEAEGIKASVIKILAENGFHTCESIAYTPRKALEALKGMSEQVLNKLYEAVKKHVEMGFTTASEIAVTRKSMVKLNTGSQELNKVLGGGIETGR